MSILRRLLGVFVMITGIVGLLLSLAGLAGLCMAKPVVRCLEGSMSPTKARKGSMEMLMEASMIQSIPAATHNVGELGMRTSATEARTAPPRK